MSPQGDLPALLALRCRFLFLLPSSPRLTHSSNLPQPVYLADPYKTSSYFPLRNVEQPCRFVPSRWSAFPQGSPSLVTNTLPSTYQYFASFDCIGTYLMQPFLASYLEEHK